MVDTSPSRNPRVFLAHHLLNCRIMPPRAKRSDELSTRDQFSAVAEERGAVYSVRPFVLMTDDDGAVFYQGSSAMTVPERWKHATVEEWEQVRAHTEAMWPLGWKVAPPLVGDDKDLPTTIDASLALGGTNKLEFWIQPNDLGWEGYAMLGDSTIAEGEGIDVRGALEGIKRGLSRYGMKLIELTLREPRKVARK